MHLHKLSSLIKKQKIDKITHKLYDKLSINSKSQRSTLYSSASSTFKLNKEIIEKTKKLNDYKSMYESKAEQLETMKKKYGNILKMYEEALENIYNKGEAKEIRQIFVDVDEFKTCEFENLSYELKISILILLIKQILPLVNENSISDNIKKSLSLVNTRYYLNDSKLNKRNSLYKITKTNKNNLNFFNRTYNGFKNIKNIMDKTNRTNFTFNRNFIKN